VATGVASGVATARMQPSSLRRGSMAAHPDETARLLQAVRDATAEARERRVPADEISGRRRAAVQAATSRKPRRRRFWPPGGRKLWTDRAISHEIRMLREAGLAVALIGSTEQGKRCSGKQQASCTVGHGNLRYLNHAAHIYHLK
jgi:hypothetical protein